MAGRNFLFIPGPTNIPDRINRAMHLAQEDMRAPTLPEFTKPLYEDMKKVFKTTTGRVFIYPASGTGGWEAAISNTLSPGDKVLMSGFGHFSNLWIDMCQRWGLNVQALEVEWGEGVPAEKYGEILAADKKHEIKAVFATQNETATGVASNIAAVRKAMDACNHPALLFVDGVSSVASMDFRMDEWKVDLCVSGSQKGFMLPTGLGIVCASPKALEAMKTAKLPRCFFDFNDQIKTNDLGFFPYTPPMNLLRGLRESLNMIFEEGLENVFARHHRYAEATRHAVKAWGLSLVAKEPKWYSDTVSAVFVPEGFNGTEVVRTAYRRYNLALSIGLAKIAGKIFRIGHLGDLNELQLLAALSGAEMAMRDIGITTVQPGSGVAAAQEFLRASAKPSVEEARKI
jgi:alanine-glyoxylate transaminase / serine-glyoxylate transaminase / serine-pyruvate transaminase